MSTENTAEEVASSLRGISNQELMLPVEGYPKMSVTGLIKEVENLTEIGKVFITDWNKSTAHLQK